MSNVVELERRDRRNREVLARARIRLRVLLAWFTLLTTLLLVFGW